MEAIGIKLFHNNGFTNVYSLYIPPNYHNESLKYDLQDLLSEMSSPFILTADANAHHAMWGSPSNDSRGSIIANLIEENNLFLLNSGEPTYLTHQGTFSHIDITICSSDVAPLYTWRPHHETFNSDHFPIMVYSDTIPEPKPSKIKWQLKRADWNKFRDTLELPTTFLSPTQACGTVTDSILKAARQSIPISRNSPYSKTSYFWNRECSTAKRAKNKAFNKYRNNLGDISLWIDYKKHKAIFKHTILNAAKKSWIEFLASLSSRTSSTIIWKQIRKLSTGPTHRAVVIKNGNNIITSPTETSEIMAQHFSKVSNGSSDNLIFNNHRKDLEAHKITFPIDSNKWYNQPFTKEELYYALAKCTSRSPGPDSIPYCFIKNFDTSQQSQLLTFFNYIYKHGFPHQWRESTIIPFLKPGKVATCTSSYRPITLTNNLCKLMEKIINRRLQHFLEKGNKYSPVQSGFRAAHSTRDALCRLEYSARSAIMERKYCVAVLIDFAQAFDTVWHHGLLQKLKNLQLIGNLPNFILNFLQLRKINVEISSTLSSSYPIHSGVPQGSVLSPTLFSIFINDLFHNLPANVQTSLYADDSTIWTISDSLPLACKDIQAALDAIVRWCNKWGLEVSTTKTKAIIFSLKHTKNAPHLTILNKTIKFEPYVKFLGILFDSKLTWKQHINHIKDKCGRDLQLLTVISSRKWGADAASLRQLYITLILSKIDYGSFLFQDAATCHLTKLDRIQYAACRIILGLLKCTNTFKLEIETDLMPLKLRRKLLLAQYGCNILSINNHPVRNLIVQYFPIQNYINSVKLTNIGNFHDILKDCKIELKDIPLTPMHLKYLYSKPQVFASLAHYPKLTKSPTQWLDLFNDLIDTNYSTRRQIYTDGSCRDGKVGCGVWSDGYSLVARLQDGRSTLTAELYAIYIAIKYISQCNDKFILLSDSLSAINSLLSLNPSNHYLIDWILTALDELPKDKVIIDWVPSHMGITGNEQADSLASSSLKLTATIKLPQSKSELMKGIRLHYHNMWEGQWKQLPATLTSFKPSPSPIHYSDIPRRQQVPLSRLRLGATILTHKHIFKKEAHPTCNLCNCRLSIRHIFVRCPMYHEEQQELRDICTDLKLDYSINSITSPLFPPNAIINFLSKTDLINKL